MPRKKTDEAVNVTELDDIIQEEADDIIPDETEEAEPDEEVKLVKGASFTSGGRLYSKGISEKVSAETAEKLMKTGFFERV